ncbi:MAG: TRAP transporter small permease [Betaproteobacteria bacterium]|nr:TRAP transporter small permease [Betaproteobacteria bacterium]
MKTPGYGHLLSVLSALGTAWIFFLMLVILGDVIGRGAFGRPILGVPEMVQFSIVGIVFLQLPATLRTGGLTRSDVLLGALLSNRPRAGHGASFFFNLIGIVVFTIIFATTWPLMQSAFANSEFYGSTGVFQIPTGPLKVIILIGTAAMAIQFLLMAWEDLRVAIGAVPPPAPPRISE